MTKKEREAAAAAKERRLTRRQSIIDGMRTLLDNLEANPEVNLPYLSSFTLWCDDEKQLARARRVLGRQVNKVFTEYDVGYNVLLDGVEVSALIPRVKVCEKEIIGVETIDAYFVPATTVEKVKWTCPDSLLRKFGEAVEKVEA